MEIRTVFEPVVNSEGNKLRSIYLAGPTVRISGDEFVTGDKLEWISEWRRWAIQLLDKTSSFDVIYVPEWRYKKRPEGWTYSRQIDWELSAMSSATVLLFWIPRDMQLLPGLTTNIEFGEFMKSGNVVAGAPSNAVKMRYIEERCSRLKIPWANTLESCIDNAVHKLQSVQCKRSQFLVTADTHFGNARTLELSKRPFKDVREMDWTIVSAWNQKSGNDDTVIHLGDFGEPAMLKHLNCKELWFVRGNYDQDCIMDELRKDPRFKELPSNFEIELRGEKFTLVHAPVDAKPSSAFVLFGHIHALQKVKRKALNVGIDCHNFNLLDESDLMFYRNAILNHYDENVFI